MNKNDAFSAVMFMGPFEKCCNTWRQIDSYIVTYDSVTERQGPTSAAALTHSSVASRALTRRRHGISGGGGGVSWVVTIRNCGLVNKQGH